MITYTGLNQFHQCPRAFAWAQFGWRKAGWNEPMETGSMVHAALRAHLTGHRLLTGGDWKAAIESYPKANSPSGLVSKKRASDLAGHYISKYIDYTPLKCELEVYDKSVDVGGHIDMVAMYKGQLSLFDFKTTRVADPRKYDISGQLDFYAFLYERVFGKGIELVVYDTISEGGTFRHERLPNLEMGEAIYNQAANLAVYIKHVDPLDDPHYGYLCMRCDYLEPCWLATFDSLDSAERALHNDYEIK